MTATYALELVVLSYVVAVLASFVALDMGSRVAEARTRLIRRMWLIAGAGAMGAGIWSMHFIGMLAYRLPIAISYHVPMTALSMVFAIAASLFALHVISGGAIRPLRLLGSGVVMGLGIAGMHYTGMAAVEVFPPIRYDPWLVAASVAVAIAAATAALWISSRLRGETILTALGPKTGSALVMAVAICGMHYTGMAAAMLEPEAYCYGNPSRFGGHLLALSIGGLTILFMAAALLVALFDARMVIVHRGQEELERAVVDRTQRIRESELATLNMMQDVLRSQGELTAAYENLKREMAERQQFEQRTIEQASLLDKAQDAIVVRGMDQCYMYWNKGAERMFGWTANEAVGRNIVELSGASAAENEDLMERLLRAGEWSGEVRRRHKDGHFVTVANRSTLVRDAGGRPQSILSISSDISDRVRAEEALRLSEIRFRSMTEQVSDTIVVLGATGVIRYISPAIFELGGYRPEEMEGQNFLPYVHPDDQPSAMNMFSEVLSRPGMIHRYEQRYRHKDGSYRHLDLGLRNLLAQPAVNGLLVSLRDVTDRRRTEDQLQRSRQALQDANANLEANVLERTTELVRAKEAAEAADRLKSQFLANMSHELRTPLNAIIGFTGTLLMRLPGELNAEQQEQLTIVQNSARHLLSLINDLLDLAKIESGKMQVQREPVACATLLGEVVDMLRPLAAKKGLALGFVPPAAEIRVPSDARAVKQIVLNLCNNAIKFTERGTVTLSLEQTDNRVDIGVTDTGSGIRIEDQGKLFQVFSQVDSTHREGSGLGLHVSQRLARLIHGEIHFQSEAGRGSRFWLTLPME